MPSIASSTARVPAAGGASSAPTGAAAGSAIGAVWRHATPSSDAAPRSGSAWRAAGLAVVPAVAPDADLIWAATAGPVARAASPPHGWSCARSSATGPASASPPGAAAGPSAGTIAGAADSVPGWTACQASSAAPASATRCCGLVRADRLPADQVDDRGRDQAARRDRARPGEPGRQPRADRADGERDRQRQVERAKLVRGVQAGLPVVAEEQHRRRDRELRQRQRGQQAAPGQPQPPAVAGGGHGREHPGGEIVVEEGAAEPHPAGHRVRPALPVAAAGAARQMRLEHVSGQPRDLAVDLSRDGHADRVAVHGVVVRWAGPGSSRSAILSRGYPGRVYKIPPPGLADTSAGVYPESRKPACNQALTCVLVKLRELSGASCD